MECARPMECNQFLTLRPRIFVNCTKRQAQASLSLSEEGASIYYMYVFNLPVVVLTLCPRTPAWLAYAS